MLKEFEEKGMLAEFCSENLKGRYAWKTYAKKAGFF
jgi:hypothetical protein